jgi:hypothetical protein
MFVPACGHMDIWTYEMSAKCPLEIPLFTRGLMSDGHMDI